MPPTTPTAPTTPGRTPVLAALLAIFFFSGAASLVYQIVWQRMLTYLYGSGFLSVTLIVSVYMGGLGLGAIWGGRIAGRWRGDRLNLYLLIEIGVGLFGILSWPFLRFLESTTASADYAVSALCMCLFLCIPTILMGFTLPIIVNVFDDLTQAPVGATAAATKLRRTVSLLYFSNTLGAAVGAVVGGMVLVVFLGFRDTLFVAAAINLTLGLSVLFLRRATASAARTPAPAMPPAEPAPGAPIPPTPANADTLGRAAYLVVLVTGFIAIGYELVWFRIVRAFSEFLSTTSYAFALVLGVYLVGIALGSVAVNAWLARHPRASPRNLLFGLQLALAAWVPLSTALYLAIFRDLGSANVWMVYGLVVFIPALVMGAGFPLVSSLAVRPGRGAGATVGTVYFFNVLGNLVGGLITGLVLLPLLGTERTLLAFSVAGALLFFGCRRAFNLRLPLAVRAAIIAVTALLAGLALPGPGGLYKYAIPFRFPEAAAAPDSYRVIEGIGGVVVRYREQGALRLRIDWSSHGDWPGYRFAHRVLLAAQYPRELERVLVVGIGVGKALEPLLHSGAKTLDVIEINPTLLDSLTELPDVQAMLQDPRVTVYREDARRFLRRDPSRYDLIVTPNMIHADAFSTNVQSLEFLRQIAEHLAPGGVAVEWVDEGELLPHTFCEAFPYVQWWGLPYIIRQHAFIVDQGMDGYLLGSNEPLGAPDTSRLARMEAGLGADYMKGFHAAREPMALIAERPAILEATGAAPLITDAEPWLEYGPWWRLIGKHPPWNVWTDIGSRQL